MKPYASYQHLAGEIMTDRDQKQIGSKFWNRGKWENFVLPHLPKDGTGLSFVDMGCNAGLFLRFAEDLNFSKIIGVDSNHESIERGSRWRDAQEGKYQFIEEKMERVIDQLPIVDYTVLCNAHYYFTINDWLEYVRKLELKTRYVIIVTAEKQHINRCWASADVKSIRHYFRGWKEVSFVNELPLEGDPDPRRLWSLCFENPILEKSDVTKLDSSNHVQDNFYRQIDEGKHYKDTGYYRVLKKYRAKWGEDRLNRWMEERLKVYADLKANGQKVPIIVDLDGVRILDGNHRYAGLVSLGNKHVFTIRTA